MSTSTRLTVAALSVVVVLVGALALQLRGPSRPGDVAQQSGEHATADLKELRAEANLAPCPGGTGARGPEKLRGVEALCLADGSPVDTAQSVAGGTILLNLWAYWCAPCADELPAMAEYQRRKGAELTVITVHQDPKQAAALARLADLDVRLPTWQDGDRRVAAALGVPNVMPATVVLRSDGSVADILARAFATADEIAAAVDPTLATAGGSQ